MSQQIVFVLFSALTLFVMCKLFISNSQRKTKEKSLLNSWRKAYTQRTRKLISSFNTNPFNTKQREGVSRFLSSFRQIFSYKHLLLSKKLFQISSNGFWRIVGRFLWRVDVRETTLLYISFQKLRQSKSFSPKKHSIKWKKNFVLYSFL